jgi:PAS domain S-box-containing protein
MRVPKGRATRRSAATQDRVAPATPTAGASSGRGPLATPSPDRVLFTVLDLSRAASVEQHDEEIVRRYVDALRDLFPERRIAVRLVAPDTGELTLVYATGRLLPDARGAVRVSREALSRHGLAPSLFAQPGVETSGAYAPLFEPGAAGFDVPLLDGDRLVGVVSVEYAPGSTTPPSDPATIVPIALQLASALRNAQLFRESAYLRDYLGKLLDNANAPIVVIGNTRQITVVNRAFLSVTGFEREDLLGRDFLKLMPEDTRRRLLPVFVGALRGEPSSNVEVEIPRARGGVARLAVDVASILTSDGQVEGVIAIARDLTEIRELQEQVIQAEKLATLGQLAAGVVHELNNPLTSITAYAQYLQRRLQDPADVERAGRILEAAERILHFTRDLVTYARPSPEQPRPVNIHEVLDQAVVFCEHVIAERGVAVRKAFAPELPPVYAVRGQLHQVFINLITNACHAVPEGRGELVLRTEAAPSGDRVRVEVTDNGAGIAPEHLERVFEPFFSTKGEGKGTGLGLSIVRNIITQHRGELAVSSRLGAGTTFTVTLLCPPDAP